jgi:hypothetical protein
MIKPACYFWRNDRIEVLDRVVYTRDFLQSSMLKYLYCHCVQSTEEGRIYSGFFDQSERFTVTWHPYDFNKFEPEFKAHLLLLGVNKP